MKALFNLLILGTLMATNCCTKQEQKDLMANLSPEELTTQASYARLAVTRNIDKAEMEFWRPEFEEFKKLLPSGKVLDLGCGAGRDALLFAADPNYEYVGIDLSDEMIQQARKLIPEADFKQMSMYNLDFASQTFDGFWASTSLLHIPKNKIDGVLCELKRVLKPKSIGFISLKYGIGEELLKRGDDVRFFALYTEQEMEQYLVHNGFKTLTAKVGTHPKSGSQQWLTMMVELIS